MNPHDPIAIQIVAPNALPAAALAEAYNYTLTRRQKLTRFLEYPELGLSNNLAENSMRPEALGRKNWIRVAGLQAGPKIAAILAVVEGCRRLKLSLRGYLAKILLGLRTSRFNGSQNSRHLPWAVETYYYSPARVQTISTAMGQLHA